MVGGDPKNKNKKKGLIHTPTLDTPSQISHVAEDPMWEDPPWSTRGKKNDRLHLGIVWTLQAHMPICTWAIQVSASNWLHRILSLLSLLENLHRSTNRNTIKMNWIWILKGASQVSKKLQSTHRVCVWVRWRNTISQSWVERDWKNMVELF